MKANNFYACSSADQVQLRYDELCKIFSDHEPMLQALKEEYSTLMSVLTEPKSVEAVKEETYIVADIIKLVQERFKAEGLRLELSGSWLWLSGTGTFAVREGLKQLGFRFNANKLDWYYRQDDHRSGNQKPAPFEFIKEKYGSKEVTLL